MKPRLFDFERARTAPRSKCLALVPLERDRCYRCGDDVDIESVGQLALFRHGGYGATRMHTFHICRNTKCRTIRCAVVVETNPRFPA